jgi:hypothetical protein
LSKKRRIVRLSPFFFLTSLIENKLTSLIVLKWWKRKDGVEEVEEAGLVNKHIFWRSSGGTTLEGRDMNS